MSIASSTRVANAVGENKPNLARLGGIASLFVGIIVSIILSITFLLIKDVWGGLFVDDEEV